MFLQLKFSVSCQAQMPAFRREGKLNTETMKCHDALCCLSSVRSLKQSSSQVKSNQQVTESETSLHADCDGETGCVFVMTDVDDIQSQKLNATSPDPLQDGTMASCVTSSSPNLETIFSPNFELSDSQLKSTETDESVKDESPELPHLIADESDDGTCCPSEEQQCSLYDFFSCDSLPTPPFDSSMTFADDMNFDYPISELTHSDIMMDMTERCMILPFIESREATSNSRDIKSIPEIMMNSDDASFYFTLDQQSDVSYLRGNPGEMDFFNPQMVFGALSDPPPAASSSCPALLPKDIKRKNPVTLVLDLDETLVHSTMEHFVGADFTFPVFFNMKEHTIYVRRRPFLQLFLEKVSQMFEIVIFTASQSIYASQLLDKLDPENKIISKRIYRESCIFSDGNYIKDLRILGVDLAKVAIIDNTPQVFKLQVDNGIPIKSWFDDPSDHALVQLLPFLETLVDAEDVRPLIAKKFGNI